MLKIKFKGKSFKYTKEGARVPKLLLYMYLLNVPSVSSRYFNKIKRKSHLGKQPVLSLEILSCSADLSMKMFYNLGPDFYFCTIPSKL